jgi:hypothetical protein
VRQEDPSVNTKKSIAARIAGTSPGVATARISYPIDFGFKTFSWCDFVRSVTMRTPALVMLPAPAPLQRQARASSNLTRISPSKLVQDLNPCDGERITMTTPALVVRVAHAAPDCAPRIAD